MKFKKLKLIILMLFFLPQYSFANDKLEYFLYCNQIPEGSPFGLIFKDNEVAQIGIENFEKVLDYKESFQKLKKSRRKWRNSPYREYNN